MGDAPWEAPLADCRDPFLGRPRLWVRSRRGWMRVQEFYSHLNGREHILVHKPGLWREIEAVVRSVDAGACRTKVSREKRKKGKVLYSPVEMNKCYERELRRRGWKPSRTPYWITSDVALIRKTLAMRPEKQRAEIVGAGRVPIFSYNQTDFVKQRIAVEVQFGKYSFVAYDMFVKHMAFFIGDVIDVGIELLPTKEFQAQMSSGVPYYEGGLYDLLRQGRSTLAVPLVLVGVSA